MINCELQFHENPEALQETFTLRIGPNPKASYKRPTAKFRAKFLMKLLISGVTLELFYFSVHSVSMYFCCEVPVPGQHF